MDNQEPLEESSEPDIDEEFIETLVLVGHVLIVWLFLAILVLGILR